MSDNRLLSYAFSRRRCVATDFSHRRPLSRKVCFVAVFAVSSSSSALASSLSKVCFAVSSSAVASSLSKVYFVAVFASAASLAFGKNRATTLAGWRTISLPKSTSLSCKTMFFVFFGCTFGNRKFATNPKRYLIPKMVAEKFVGEKKCAPVLGALSATEKCVLYKYQQILDLVLCNRKMCSLQNWLPKNVVA